ncbi:helix-turn-helix domain-containing protein [Bacillus massiliigorillae]|uniref:helix-turn-helix domain-containing protein n=1 Tax=Bacillus massiliigorillae TaxID=1243664 RepID=UPI0003A7A1A9|nr:helix-turn-helix transcriptional regulator [Bacillus massiliigorillae]
MSQIGKNIKVCRENRNMSVEDLALKVRCGTKTLESYENGTNIPNNETILKLSTALDVAASELLEGRLQ